MDKFPAMIAPSLHHRAKRKAYREAAIAPPAGRACLYPVSRTYASIFANPLSDKNAKRDARNPDVWVSRSAHVPPASATVVLMLSRHLRYRAATAPAWSVFCRSIDQNARYLGTRPHR